MSKYLSIGVIILSVTFGVALGLFIESVHAQEPIKSWVIYRGESLRGYPAVIKIQDGPCSIYIATDGVPGVGIATGQGCK